MILACIVWTCWGFEYKWEDEDIDRPTKPPGYAVALPVGPDVTINHSTGLSAKLPHHIGWCEGLRTYEEKTYKF